MRSTVRWAVLAAVASASVVFAQGAAPRISLAPVRGDKNNAVGSQLTGEVCKAYDCVPYTRASTNKKPDWNKARKEKVAGILTTNITKTKKGYNAGVALLMGSSKVKRSWNFPLTAKRNLSSAQLKQLTHEMGPTMGFAEDVSGVAAIAAAEAAKPAPPPVATTTPTSPMSTAPPPAVITEPTVIPPPPGAPEKSLADVPVSADAASAATPSGVRGQPLFSVEVGGDFLNRDLTYSPSTQAGLRTYSASVIGMLLIGVELFPFAKSGGFLTGLGIFGSYQFSIGLKSQTQGGVEESTNFNMLAAGIEARIRPIKYSDFALVIPVAFRTYNFTVSNASAFTGLPNQNLLGVSAGLKVEIPIGSWFLILIGGDYVFWFQKKELIGNSNPVYFPSGSAGAFEAELGFGFYIVGPLSLRLVGEYSNTSYSFNPDPTGTYNATGASDRLLGGRAVIRLDF
jgi:hypothetical protein